MLRCTPQNVRSALKDGRLKGEKDEHGHWQIPIEELERYLQKKAYSVTKIAKTLGYHREHIRRLLRVSLIPGEKIRGHWVLTESITWPNKRHPIVRKPKQQ